MGWYIPEFMTQDPSLGADPQFILSYRYFRTTPKYRLITGSKTWSMVDEQIVRNLKLNLQVENAPENDTELFMIDTLVKAQREKQPVIVVFWIPHQLFGTPHPPQRVYLPAYTEDCRKRSNIERGLIDCDYPPTTLNKLQSDAVSTLSPQVQRFLKNFKYQGSDQVQIMADIYYGKMEPRDAACKWLLNNTDLWKSWLREEQLPITQQDLGFSVGMAVMASSIFGILIIAVSIVLIACSIQKRSTPRKMENKLAPKTAPICIVFTSIQNASLLWTLASDIMKKVMNIHNRVIRNNIKKFRGYEVKTHADCFMMAFSDPMDAVACCLQIQKDLLHCEEWTSDMLAFPDMQKVEWNGQLVYHGPRVKIGMHFGSDIEAQFDTTTRRYDYFGTTVNKASRVSKICERGGRIYVSEETMQACMHQVIVFSNQASIRKSLNVSHKHFTSSPEYSTVEEINATHSLKRLVASGQVMFEFIGEVNLKGLSGRHAIYWVKDVNDPRSKYIEQFEMRGGAIAKIATPSSLLLPTLQAANGGDAHPCSPSHHGITMQALDTTKNDLKFAIECALKNVSKMSEEEKSIIIQRFVLWSFGDEYDHVDNYECSFQDMWMKYPDYSLMKFITSMLIQQSNQPCPKLTKNEEDADNGCEKLTPHIKETNIQVEEIHCDKDEHKPRNDL